MWDIHLGSCSISATVEVETTTPPNVHWSFLRSWGYLSGLSHMDLNIHPTAVLEGYQLSRELQWGVQPNSLPSWSSWCRNNSEMLQQMKIPYRWEPVGET